MGIFRLISLISLVLLVSIFALYTTFNGNSMYYLTIDEFHEKHNQGIIKNGQIIKVVGNLVPGSFVRNDLSLESKFSLQSNTENKINALFVGPIPDSFFTTLNEIVLEGKLGNNGIFLVDDVTVKCPSKFLTPEEELTEIET